MGSVWIKCVHTQRAPPTGAGTLVHSKDRQRSDHTWMLSLEIVHGKGVEWARVFKAGVRANCE